MVQELHFKLDNFFAPSALPDDTEFVHVNGAFSLEEELNVHRWKHGVVGAATSTVLAHPSNFTSRTGDTLR